MPVRPARPSPAPCGRPASAPGGPPGSATARGLFCGIGACFDCLATVDGAPASGSASPRPARAWMVRKVPFFTYSAARAPVNTPARCGTTSWWSGPGRPGWRRPPTAALGGARVALLDAGAAAGRPVLAAPGRARPERTGTGTGRCSRGFGPLWRNGSTTSRGRRCGSPSRRRSGTSCCTPRPAGSEAPKVVLATGAYDRALPFPGWDLPGVVTPGAAQALLKGSGVPVGPARSWWPGPGRSCCRSRSGLLEAGVRVVAVLEAGNPRGVPARPGVLAGVAGKFGEAAGYAAALARHRVPYRPRHAVAAAHGRAGRHRVQCGHRPAGAAAAPAADRLRRGGGRATASPPTSSWPCCWAAGPGSAPTAGWRSRSAPTARPAYPACTRPGRSPASAGRRWPWWRASSPVGPRPGRRGLSTSDIEPGDPTAGPAARLRRPHARRACRAGRLAVLAGR